MVCDEMTLVAIPEYILRYRFTGYVVTKFEGPYFLSLLPIYFAWNLSTNLLVKKFIVNFI